MVAFCVGVLVVTGCGDISDSGGRVSVGRGPVRRVVDQEPHPMTTTTFSAVKGAAAAQAAFGAAAKYAAGGRQETGTTASRQPVSHRESPAAPSVRIGTAIGVLAGDGNYPCGNNVYPPCYVAQRESGNTYTAYNPTGCGGSGCYGRWQFGGFWRGRLGLPYDIANASPQQQDAAARLLWNHGAGCSNWNAC